NQVCELKRLRDRCVLNIAEPHLLAEGGSQDGERLQVEVIEDGFQEQKPGDDPADPPHARGAQEKSSLDTGIQSYSTEFPLAKRFLETGPQTCACTNRRLLPEIIRALSAS